MNNGILVQKDYRELFVNDSLPVNGIGKNSNTPSINGPNVGSYDPNNLVFVIDTSKEPANYRVSIPLIGTVNCTIFWGDGTSETHTTTGFKTHLYEKPGIYIIQIQGTMTSLSFGGGANTTDNKLKLVRVLSFGNFGLTGSFRGLQELPNLIECPSRLPSSITDFRIFFRGCSSFNDPNITQWDTSKIIFTGEMFMGAAAFNQNISTWNTSSVTAMGSMFNSSLSFNQPIGGWNTSSATDMNSVFAAAITFNQDLSNWNTSNVTNMLGMFEFATRFNNGDSNGINNWNTSKVVNFNRMFRSTVFNQPLNNWNTSSGVDMSLMFNAAVNFNQPLNNWNVRKVTNFSSMFSGSTSFNSSLSGWALGADTAGTNCTSMFNGATSFNQDLSSWNTSKITNMTYMFFNSSVFNTNIGNWDVSNVTNFGQMFQGASLFNNGGNPGINGWNTSNCTSMVYMFAGSSFNQPIGSWNVSKVQNMTNMFNGAGAFNQDISSWNLAGLNVNTALDAFMTNKNSPTTTYSTTNYDALLIGWNNNKLASANGVANWRTDLRPNFGGAKYTGGGAAAAARAALVSYGWTITDGGVA